MMQNHGSFLGIALLMFAAGVGIPLMATLNAGLGQQIGSPATATAILYVVGLVLSLALLFAAGGPPAPSAFAGVRPHFYLGAAFVVFYIFSITWAAPRIGIGNAVFFVLFGQIVAAALIDHLGLWGALRAEITGRRLAGMAIMAVGLYLARKPV